jgi:hypothetical protein
MRRQTPNHCQPNSVGRSAVSTSAHSQNSVRSCHVSPLRSPPDDLPLVGSVGLHARTHARMHARTPHARARVKMAAAAQGAGGRRTARTRESRRGWGSAASPRRACAP